MGRIILGVGARGELVERLQTRLLPFGFSESQVDGIFGVGDTKNAVRLYQASHHLNVSADVDTETWEALVGPVPTVKERALGVLPLLKVTAIPWLKET